MQKYKYVDLKSATGSVNVIAIAKYAGKPKKTKGSGYSLFLSITDPSLNGDKMSCIVFHDSEENLPQIQSPGDIIIMHRLVVKQYNGRNQGCGYGTTGFSAAVFSGVHSDPLIPFKSNTRCSFGDEELKVVEYLKQWYISPNCPVERENLRSSSEQGSNEANRNCGSGIKLLGLLKEEGFCTVEGQIISIYNSVEMDNSVIIYIWDGSLSNNEQDIVFTGLPQNRLCQLLPYSQHDPHLVALTGHNLQQWNESILKDSKIYTEENLHNVLEPNFASTFLETFREDKNCHEMFTDWSVPIYIYDEHTINEPIVSLKPGDLIRIHNVHVCYGREKHNHLTNLRLILHGKGHEFGRGVKYLGDKYLLINYLNGTLFTTDDGTNLLKEANKYGLLDNLKSGINSRPPLLSPKHELLLPYELQQPLTISQISNIPLIINKRDRELNDWSLLYPIQTETIPSIPPNSWLAVTNLPPSASNFNVVYTRLCARVIEVAPLNVSMLKDCLLLTCSNCLTLFRASCISDNDNGLCDCGSRLAILPFMFLQLEDSTGKLILTVSGRNVMDLINNLVEEDLKSCINNDAWWTGLIFEMKELQNIDISPAKIFLEQCVRLLGQWIDVAVKISWSKESVPAITNITNDNDLQYNFIDWNSL
ncbi:hypothetical protein MN116_002167 [Schistosoma mekongi]|uniref:Protection of telomeres protein 1 n=1 Tax=Schistosoma mekongi TaxID=38744 RepID=A0AAE2D8E7_SCHME|nr:hypothetical protein MN116_002167 [Schistosoma mekongi]